MTRYDHVVRHPNRSFICGVRLHYTRLLRCVRDKARPEAWTSFFFFDRQATLLELGEDRTQEMRLLRDESLRKVKALEELVDVSARLPPKLTSLRYDNPSRAMIRIILLCRLLSDRRRVCSSSIVLCGTLES